MTFVSGNSVFCGSDAGLNEVVVDIQSTTNRIYDFQHNTIVSKIFEKTGIDWIAH